MKRVFWILLFCFLAVPVLAPAPAAEAFFMGQKKQDDHDEALEAIKRGDILPYSHIKRMVEDRLSGVIVGQKLRRTNRGWQYDLRVRRKDGKVLVAIVDAASGHILSTK
ncbi:MAG: hypothetical protein EP335_14655 [Alphaproteobacteria bacterium]|nr:MAG: hypothetical protein EP335_14655 [Alphaproteobacteria bacterium]